jgi:hypothetical protein
VQVELAEQVHDPLVVEPLHRRQLVGVSPTTCKNSSDPNGVAIFRSSGSGTNAMHVNALSIPGAIDPPSSAQCPVSKPRPFAST